MYQTILVPLDGSAFGEHALPYALAIARRAGAAIRLVQVHEPAATIYSGEVSDCLTLNDILLKREQAYLDDVSRRLQAIAPVRVESALLQAPVADAIRHDAQTHGTDLIVLTTHGRGPLSRFWLGSIADQLIHQSPAPLLVIQPREGKLDLQHEPALGNMMIPLDGSPLAEQILGPANQLAKVFNAACTLVNVIKPEGQWAMDWSPPQLLREMETLAQQLHQVHVREQKDTLEYLEKMAERLRAQGVVTQCRVVTQDASAAGILAEAKVIQADVIALATHGRRGLARLLRGSVADKVLRGGTTPLLILRPVDYA